MTPALAEPRPPQRACGQATRRRIIFAGGGTGGHLLPGLAVAEMLRRLHGDDVEIVFVGSGAAFERKHVAQAGFTYHELACRPWRRSPLAWPMFLATHWHGIRQAKRLLDEHATQVVVGLGGYASLPMAWAAASRDVPLVLLEQNAVAGKANRWLARWASKICLGLDAARTGFSRLPAGRFVTTGTPLRASFTKSLSENRRGLAHFATPCEQNVPVPLSAAGSRTGSKQTADLRRERLLVIFGGSGGARQLNEAVPRALSRMPELREGWQIIHQTGAHGLASTKALYARLGIEATVRPWLDELPRLLARAGLVVCRAGGTTLAELAATGTPSLVCPYPYAADDHQRRNARVFAGAGACAIIDPSDVPLDADSPRLEQVLGSLLGDPPLRRQLGEAALRQARPAAADAVASIVARYAKCGEHADGPVL